MAEVRAVIFDVDGVLVDSYQAHFESWKLVGEENGQVLTEEVFAREFGRTSREIIADIWPAFGESAERIAEFDDRKEALYREIVMADFPAMEGAVELIDSLDEAGFRLGVGSSGPPENVEMTIKQLGRADLFKGVITGADVSRGKPDPEVFLACAERMGVSPSNCAVIEDAAAGIAAANAAGMASIALVSRGHHRDEYGEAQQIVDRLEQLSPASIAEWIDS